MMDCPQQWQTFEDHCYLFVFDQSRDYTDAATACWVQGSALVSINGEQEHSFVKSFLNTHGRNGMYTWYTSGVATYESVTWYGDGTQLPIGPVRTTYWINPNEALVGSEDNGSGSRRIVYRYSAETLQYGWGISPQREAHNYICEISRTEVVRIIQQSRNFEYGLSDAERVNVLRGPSLMGVSQDLVVVDVDTVYLECITRGNPLPTHRWYRSSMTRSNKLPLQEMVEVTSDSGPRYTLTGGRLTISNPVETLDSGFYLCRADNPLGAVLSPPIHLSFGYLTEFSPNQQGFVEARQNLGTLINCNAPSAKPALSYNWYKDDTSNFIRPELTDYFFISGNGNLYLSEVQLSDGGYYFCSVSLTPGIGEELSNQQPPGRTSRPIELRVQGGPSAEYGPIIHNDFISVFPKPALVGHELRLECFAYGRMPMRYSWSRDGQPFPEGTYFRYSDRVMIIPNVKFRDEGKYTCAVETVTGKQRVVTKTIILALEAKPYFVFPLRDQHADEGSDVTWRCEARAVPRAVYTWYLNGEILRDIPGKLEVRRNILVIRKLEKSHDPGVYMCTATNVHGTAFSSAELRVLAFPPTFARAPWPQQTIAAEGGNLTLHCNPEAAPQPVLEWSRNGQSLISGAGGAGVEVLIDGTLVVSGLTLSDQGRYECIATNLLGEARASTEVVIATGLRFLQTPIDTEGTVNTTLFLYCEASFHRQLFDMSYIWKFNGRIIDTERGHFYKKGSSNHLNGLYIVNAQYQHTGTYECIATTVMSSISASAIVHVKGPPGEPAGVYTDRRAPTDSMSASVVWIWNSAHNHGYPVTFFIIESHTEFRQEWTVLVSDIPESQTLVPDSPEPMRRRFVVGNLLPNNNYRFRVRAVNQAGVGLPSRPSDQYHVPAACPVTAPFDVSGGGGSVGTLTITWTALNMEEVGGDQFGYIVYWRLADDKTAFNQEDVGNVTSYTVTVGVDNYFLLYHVKVQPYNILGLGPVSEVAEVYSAEGMPVVRPTNVRSYDYNSTAALITWDTVTDDRETVKGRVRGYRVDYYSLRDTDGQNGSLNVHCQCGEAIIVGLTPGGYYNVRVSVFNMAGLSTQSESYLVAVLDPAPGLAPQFVAVVGNGPNSVKVTWRGVVQQFGEPSLLKYKVMWWQVGDDIRMAESTTIRMPATTAVIRGLQSDVIYKLRVLAVNIGGEGQKSPSVLFTLTQGRTLHVHPSTFDPATSEILLSSATSTSGCVCILTVSLILAFLSDIQQKS